MSDQGRFAWFELMSTDPAGAQDFYTKLVGWNTTKFPGPMDYTMFTKGETPIAGVMQLPEEAQQAGAPTHWLGYVNCDDIAATTAQAKELGATVMHEMEIPDVGKVAILKDPQGAMICFYQPENALSPEQDAEVGDVTWHELMTTDYKTGFDFYQKLFGWDVMDDMDMGEHGIYRIFGRNGKPLGGMFNKPAEAPTAAWLYYAHVPCCDDAAAKIAELGGQVVNGPMEVPGGDKIVQAMDPQGGMFALHSSAAATKAADA